MKKFNITWTPGDDGGAAITGHDVGYTPSGGSETVVATGSTAAAYTLGGLTDNVEYSVRVRAENSAGKGAWSSAVVQTAALFAPSDITGLQWWFDASDATTITESSGDVSAIADKVAGTYSLEGYPAASAYYPTLTASAENGLSAIDFDGSDDLMRLPSGQKIDLLPTLTLFLVASPSTTSNSYMLCDTYGASGAGRQPAILSGYNISGSGGSGSYEWYTLDGSKFQSFGAGLSGIQLLTLLYDSSGNTVLRRNGIQVSSGASDTTFTSVAGFTALGGAASGSGQAAFRFCELAAYDSVLTGTDLTDCEDYLLAKWGIS